MKKKAEDLSIITRIIIFLGCVLLVIICPLIIQIGSLVNNPTINVLAPFIYVLAYLLIGWLAWSFLKPNLKLPQFTRFTSDEINTIFKTVGLIYVLNFIFNLLAQYLYQATSTQNQKNIESLLSINHLVLIVFSLTAAFIAPFVEEFIFRGLVINYFFVNSNWWINVILSGMLFSLGHASTNIVSFILYATMGSVLAYIYKKSGKIKLSIAVHMVNNTIAMLLTILTIFGVLK
ncbi:CPBP family intramembrane glutamic endopeptidase [Periweissella beninensis]|uniref:CPBP family intramembrane metalloprotease n=1 Tax=Periweissella beninensis TaxID=504936 RepID=A0ABT0VJH8_9LACO|nr:type II CAAX endopeptidase family protein [Periweissella beninensis]MBM7544781.1 membrane protease YdiL (CAAX protease family) [Periweissella beninensis]MCM2437019.1 CPBP family intramembrane metalloprotease [Periweissella beninensis]MCT4395811.1 CPBP family intramembrane metalloprotease [Periweissella beninensis]